MRSNGTAGTACFLANAILSGRIITAATASRSRYIKTSAVGFAGTLVVLLFLSGATGAASAQSNPALDTVFVPRKDASGTLRIYPQACVGTCSALTHAQVARVAFLGGADWAGLRAGALVNAVAIAEAESSLFLNAIHYGSNGSVDRGLWQINSVHGYNENLLLSDASYNARAAYRIAEGAKNVDWTPWSAFRSGSFVQFLGSARTAARNIDPKVIRAANDRILADATLTVRSTAGGTVIGQITRGARGTVTAGPVVAPLGGYNFVWWRINWDGSGADGWSPEDDMFRVPAGTLSNDLLADFGASGLWQRINNLTWFKIHATSPLSIATADLDGAGGDEVIASFNGLGLYARYNNATWRKLHATAPRRFGAGDFDGNGRRDLVLDFGNTGVWLFLNNTTWKKINAQASSVLATGDVSGDGKDEVLSAFPSGLYAYYFSSSAWVRLNSATPRLLVSGDMDVNGKDDVVADFGSSGIWVRMNNAGAWIWLHRTPSTGLALGNIDGLGGDDLLVVFDAGLYVRYQNGSWRRLSAGAPGSIAAVNLDSSAKADVAADFGAQGLKVLMNNGASWQNLNALRAEGLAAGDVH